eukprot:49473-Rhodomonas_salina.3
MPALDAFLLCSSVWDNCPTVPFPSRDGNITLRGDVLAFPLLAVLGGDFDSEPVRLRSTLGFEKDVVFGLLVSFPSASACDRFAADDREIFVLPVLTLFLLLAVAGGMVARKSSKRPRSAVPLIAHS